MERALAELDRRGLPYAMVRGQGAARVKSALAAVHGLAPPFVPPAHRRVIRL